MSPRGSLNHEPIYSIKEPQIGDESEYWWNVKSEENSTLTEVGSYASNIHLSQTQERPQSSNTVDQHDNRPDEECDNNEVINLSFYHIVERYLGDSVLS